MGDPRRNVRTWISQARNEIDHEWRQFPGEPDGYVAEVINTIERGDLHQVADDWARQQNEYVYQHEHAAMERDWAGTDEWQEAERHAAKVVAMRLDQRLYPLAPDAGSRLIKMRDMLRAEAVAEFLTDVYTSAVWEWLNLIRLQSDTARIFLLDQACHVAANGGRDVPCLD